MNKTCKVVFDVLPYLIWITHSSVKDELIYVSIQAQHREQQIAQSSNTVIMKFLVKRKSMLLFFQFYNLAPQLAVASVFATVTCSALPQRHAERYLNQPDDNCFGRAKIFRNLLRNPPRNGECCLSNRIARRPRVLDVCCRLFVDEAEEGGYLSRCPTVPRGRKTQEDRDSIFNVNRRGKREILYQ